MLPKHVSAIVLSFYILLVMYEFVANCVLLVFIELFPLIIDFC